VNSHIDIIGLTVAVVLFILSIPMAFLVNLYTPNVQHWWASRSISRYAAYTKKLEDNFDFVAHLVSDMQAFHVYSYGRILRVILRLSIAIVSLVMLSTVVLVGVYTDTSANGSNHTLFGMDRWSLDVFLDVAAYVYMMIAMICFFILLWGSMTTLSRVSDFSSFKAKREALIAARKARVP